MGKRGPRPTPTALLKVRGSWRGTYANKSEPKPDGTPECPKEMPGGKKAQAIWKQVVESLEPLRMLATTDGRTLERYCWMFVRWRLAAESEEVELSVKLSAALLKIEQEFGMTPSARSRITVPENEVKEENGKRRFFAG